MQNYKTLKQNAKQFLAVTGVEIKIFEQLFEFFEKVWYEYIFHYTVSGELRQRIKAKRKDNAFEDVQTMLVFILSYLKNNPLQETHASMFGMNQPQCNLWIHILKRILHKSLSKAKTLPLRSTKYLQKALSGTEDIFVDGSERPIPRPKDKDVQKDYYSGKKTSYDKKYYTKRYE
jgi:hypothetical protein